MEAHTNFFGTDLSQAENMPVILNKFLNIVRPETIIEIGTFKGGLSVLFQLYSISNNKTFVTYDITDFIQNKQLFLKLNIDRRLSNVFTQQTMAEIVSLIQRNGVTVIFCDGGNKIAEFNYFGQYLKKNDYILAHDYAIDMNHFNNTLKDKLWNWCEITDADIQKICDENNLKKVYDQFNTVAITCRKKE